MTCPLTDGETYELHSIVAAAANGDLFRTCGTGSWYRCPVGFRTRAGQQVDAEAVLSAFARGLLGAIRPAEELPDGAWAELIEAAGKTDALDEAASQ